MAPTTVMQTAAAGAKSGAVKPGSGSLLERLKHHQATGEVLAEGTAVTAPPPMLASNAPPSPEANALNQGLASGTLQQIVGAQTKRAGPSGAPIKPLSRSQLQTTVLTLLKTDQALLERIYGNYITLLSSA